VSPVESSNDSGRSTANAIRSGTVAAEVSVWADWFAGQESVVTPLLYWTGPKNSVLESSIGRTCSDSYRCP